MYGGISQNHSAILDQCFDSKIKVQYKGDVESLKVVNGQIDPEYKYIVQFTFNPISKRVLVKEERYIISTTDFIGSVGGSLGLFLGFSCFTYTSELLDKLLNKLSSLL